MLILFNFDAAVGWQNPQISQFVSFQLIGSSLLNFFFVQKN